MASKVFAPHDELVWVTAVALSPITPKGEVEIRIADPDLPGDTTTKVITLSKYGLTELPLQNLDLPVTGIADMCNLPHLHEASILDNLRRRFFGSHPYTYSSEICIAINPYRWLDIYTPELRDTYKIQSRMSLPPHVYATSASAFRGLSQFGKNQSILVSGESGAGKTETVKIMMSHVTHIAKHSGNNTIEKLLKANPLLESFGNAKTVRNDNSSRFGKFSQLQFNAESILVGSKCVTYLLEKTRVVTQFPGERNYHVFYQLLSAPPAIKKSLCLSGRSIHEFHYTNMGDTNTNVIEGRSDGDRFISTIEALELLDIKDNVLNLVLNILSGVLFLGNVNLLPNPTDADASLLDIGVSKLSSGIEEFASPRTGNVVTCINLLGLNMASFSDAITSRSIDVEGQKLSVPLTIDQAIGGRDALAKEIYARLFQWLVMVINFNTSYRPSSESETLGTISLLDIFGFESFAVNRFEQLCINYANEKLQQKFTMDVLLSVQKEYEAEGVRWAHIQIVDNSELLEMIDGKKGLIQVLNEECMVPKGSDLTLFSKLKSAFASSPSLYATNPRFKDQFTITHYAGKVTYNINGFLERNKDTLPEDMRVLLVGSSNPLLSKLFSEGEVFTGQSNEADELLRSNSPAFIRKYLLLDPLENSPESSSAGSRTYTFRSADDEPAAGATVSGLSSGKKLNRRSSFMSALTVTTKFKNQLSKLMESISLTQVQYVRCIKSNTNKSPSEFNRMLIVEQLRSAGMIAAISISRAAYPSRLPYKEFFSRYRILRPEFWHKNISELQQRRNITDSESRLKDHTKCLFGSLLPDIFGNLPRFLDNATGDDVPPNVQIFQFGITKVFFAAGIIEKLEAFRTEAMMELIVILQTFGRMCMHKCKFTKMKLATVYIQAVIRGYIQRKPFLKRKRAIFRIQTAFRRYHARRIFISQRRMQIFIASLVRMRRAKRVLQRLIREHYEKLERERLERERLERERHERERIENERRELERREKLKAEQDRLSALEKEKAQSSIQDLPSITALSAESIRMQNARTDGLAQKVAPHHVGIASSGDPVEADQSKDFLSAPELGRSSSIDSLMFSPSVVIPSLQLGTIGFGVPVAYSPVSTAPSTARTTARSTVGRPPPLQSPKSENFVLSPPREVGVGSGIASDDSIDSSGAQVQVQAEGPLDKVTIKFLQHKVLQLETALLQSRDKEDSLSMELNRIQKNFRELEESFNAATKSLASTKDKLMVHMSSYNELEAENESLKRQTAQLETEKKLLQSDMDSKNSDLIALKQALKQTQLRATEKSTVEEGEKSFFGGIFTKKSSSMSLTSSSANMSGAVERVAELETELMNAIEKLHLVEEDLAAEKRANSVLRQTNDDLNKAVLKRAGSVGNRIYADSPNSRSRSPTLDGGSSDTKTFIATVASETAAQMRKEFDGARRDSMDTDNIPSDRRRPAMPARSVSNPNLGRSSGPPPSYQASVRGLDFQGQVDDTTLNGSPVDQRLNIRTPPQYQRAVPTNQGASSVPPYEAEARGRRNTTNSSSGYSSSPTSTPPAQFSGGSPPVTSAFLVTMPQAARSQTHSYPEISAGSATPNSHTSTPHDLVTTGRSTYRSKSPSPIVIPDTDTDSLPARITEPVAISQHRLSPPRPVPQRMNGAARDGAVISLPNRPNLIDHHNSGAPPPYASIQDNSIADRNVREGPPGPAVRRCSEPGIVDLSRVSEMIDSASGWPAILYLLVSKTSEIVMKHAIIRHSVASSPTGPFPEDLFEIELIENENNSGESNKKMKFSAYEIRRAAKGKGKLAFPCYDSLCMILVFRGGKVKGELNIVFPSEVERDMAVMYFSMIIPKSLRGDDVSVDSNATPTSSNGGRHPSGHRPPSLSNQSSNHPQYPPYPQQSSPSQGPTYQNLPPSAHSHGSPAPPGGRRNTMGGPPPPMRSASPVSRVVSGQPGGNLGQFNSSERISRTNSRDSVASNNSASGIPAHQAGMPPPPPPVRYSSSPVMSSPGNISSRSTNGRVVSSRSAIDALEAPSPQITARSALDSGIKKEGWVLRQDVGSNGKVLWTKKFMILDCDNSLLRFGTSPALAASTREGSLRISRDMRCSRPPDSDEDNCLVEIADTRGLRLRVQLTSSEDQLEWLTAINSLLE